MFKAYLSTNHSTQCFYKKKPAFTLLLRCLELHYPYFPTEKDFTHSVVSSGDISHHSEGEHFRLLSRFALMWPRLQAGGVLLPDLVEFYQWLHSSLAHIVSYDTASNVPIGSVIQHAVRRYSPDMGQHLRQLYDRIKGEKYIISFPLLSSLFLPIFSTSADPTYSFPDLPLLLQLATTTMWS